jgi:hypothetical protein
MKLLRSGVLAVLVLTSVVALVVSPALATPRLTVSTGSRPDAGGVSPFITPIGNSETSGLTITNRYTSGRGLSFKARTAGGTSVVATCSELRASAFVPVTHTQIRASSFALSGCKVDGLGVPATMTTRGVDSTTPILLHARRTPAADSWDGTFNISRAQSFEIVTTVVPCRLTLREGQSVAIRGTDARTQIEANSAAVLFKSEVGSNSAFCPAPQGGAAVLEAASSMTYRHDTAITETRFKSTATSGLAHKIGAPPVLTPTPALVGFLALRETRTITFEAEEGDVEVERVAKVRPETGTEQEDFSITREGCAGVRVLETESCEIAVQWVRDEAGGDDATSMRLTDTRRNMVAEVVLSH